MERLELKDKLTRGNARFVRQDREDEVLVGDESFRVRTVRVQARPRDKASAIKK